jgi:membrane protease YdiL (CAAX protease family)
MKTFIKNHPVIAYYILVFGISFGGILAVVGGPKGLPGAAEEQEKLVMPVMLMLFAGPSLGGLLMTLLVKGRQGFRDLGARISNWRVNARWYVVALLTAPILFTAVSLALSTVSGKYLPGIVVSNDRFSLLVFGLSYGLIGGGLLEELGWTGFAVPSLRLKNSVIRTALIIGILWGAWHFMVIYWMSDPHGEVPLWLLLPIQLFSWLPAYRILMLWVYERTGGSLLLAMIMHASLSASMLIFQPQGLAGFSLLTFIISIAAVLWLLAILVYIADRKVFSGNRNNN